MTEQDKWDNPFFHKSKRNGYFYEMSNDPINDSGMDHLDKVFTVSDGIITMKPNGATSFGVGKNVRGFKDSIGGCDMNFEDTAKRGFAYKPDDVRDLEFKCLMQIDGLDDSGFSISACTGHHDSNDKPCCQGFAYMFNLDPDKDDNNRARFRFRKEMYHVKYFNSPEGWFKHPSVNFQVDGHGWFGFGFCRYNVGNDSVALEGWFNPNPEEDTKNWKMLKKIVDKPGNGWGKNIKRCGGAIDQVGTWSNVQNRLKTNSKKGTIQFKQISLREIDPNLD